MRLRGRSPRALALGSQGDEVFALQERLRSLGYDPGPVDGCYGYMTQDAVTAFQHDNGLKPDGIAGPRVLSLANQPQLPGRRQALVLGAGESLASAANRFGISLEALRLINHLAPGARGYPGQRLVYRTHYVLGALSVEDKGWRVVGRAINQLSALSVPAAVIVDGRVERLPLPASILAEAARLHMPVWLAAAPMWLWHGQVENRMDVSLLLCRAKTRKAAAVKLAALAGEQRAGLWLDAGRPRWGDGPRLLGFAKVLKESLAQMGLPFMITLPMPEGGGRWRWWMTDIDYASLASLADKVVLGAHIPSGLDSFAGYCQRLEALLDVAPAWKALLGIGLQAEERSAQGEWLGWMAYAHAVTTAYLAKSRPKWDPARKMLRAPLTAHPAPPAGGNPPADARDRVLWLPCRDAVAERLALVHRYNLAGVVMSRLGEEDARVWDVVPKRIAPELWT